MPIKKRRIILLPTITPIKINLGQIAKVTRGILNDNNGYLVLWISEMFHGKALVRILKAAMKNKITKGVVIFCDSDFNLLKLLMYLASEVKIADQRELCSAKPIFFLVKSPTSPSRKFIRAFKGRCRWIKDMRGLSSYMILKMNQFNYRILEPKIRGG